MAGLDPKAQAFLSRHEAEWDGAIGPKTWHAIDRFAPEPAPNLTWDFVFPLPPPPKPIFL